MKIEDYRGYELHHPTSGGKAGKGFNKTGSIQVRKGGRIVKQFRYEMRIFMDKARAKQRANEWVDAQLRVRGAK